MTPSICGLGRVRINCLQTNSRLNSHNLSFQYHRYDFARFLDSLCRLCSYDYSITVRGGDEYKSRICFM